MVAWNCPLCVPIQGVADLANGFGGGSVFRGGFARYIGHVLLRNNVANALTLHGGAQLSAAFALLCMILFFGAMLQPAST
jgi:hypothetical protein